MNKSSGEDPYYVVVEFIEEEDNGELPMDVISSKWINTEENKLFCYWPKCLNDTYKRKLVERHEDIGVNNIKCRIAIKYKSKIYQRALEKMKLLQNQSNVSQTEGEEFEMERTKKKRKPKINSKYNYSDFEESSSEELPLVPPPNPKNKLESIRNPVNKEIHQLMGHTVEKEGAITTENSQLLNCDVDIQKKKVAPVKFGRNPVPEAETNSEVMVLSPSTSSETFLCNGCKKSEDLLPKLMEKLEMVADDVKYLLLCQAVNKEEHISLSKPFMSCKTKEELVKLEDSLDDEEVFQSTCVVFQAVGGKDIIDTTRRILSKLLSAELANQYNWTGRNSKQQFSKFHNILKILLVAVRRNPLSRNATAKDIEQVTKHYLRNSFDRGLNRGIRLENLDI